MIFLKYLSYFFENSVVTILITNVTFSETKSRLYPFGLPQRDIPHFGADEKSSRKVLFGQPFLFYGQFVTSAYVSLIINFAGNFVCAIMDS